MEQLQFSIIINVPREKVWDTMLDRDSWVEWTSVWMEGSYYEGEWKEGGEIKFMGPDKSGTKARITDLRPKEFVSMEHIAALGTGAIEDTESEQARSWIGSTESYTLNDVSEGTKLDIEITTYPEWRKMHEDGWPKALEILKELAEKD